MFDSDGKNPEAKVFALTSPITAVKGGPLAHFPLTEENRLLQSICLLIALKRTSETIVNLENEHSLCYHSSLS